MVLYAAILMLAVLPFVLLSVYVGITGLPPSYYDQVAQDRAKGEYYASSGTMPESVTVLGRNIAITAGDVDISAISYVTRDWVRYRKAMVEQALINTCITLQTRCQQNSIDLLWAFLPASSGAVSDVLSGESSSTLDCSSATSTEYARYGRYLFQTAIPSEMLATSAGAMYYSKPSGASSTGCSFQDLVDIR